jgi:hypothetical protein
MLTRADGTRYKSAGYRYDGDDRRLDFKVNTVERLWFSGISDQVFNGPIDWSKSETEYSLGIGGKTWLLGDFGIEGGTEFVRQSGQVSHRFRVMSQPVYQYWEGMDLIRQFDVGAATQTGWRNVPAGSTSRLVNRLFVNVLSIRFGLWEGVEKGVK